MNRLRRWSVFACLICAAVAPPAWLHAAKPPDDKKTGEKTGEKWFEDRVVTVSPAPAPVPALRYRLYPSFMERKEGNAVPIYLRFAHERGDARKKELREKPQEWNKLPLDNLPLPEVRKFLDGYKYNLKQLELGARRRTADWSYTLDAGDPIGLLLPDVQEMRMHAPLLVLKARVEIAEKRYADAVRTLETGFSFSQQMNEGPFLINSLVGIAVGYQFSDCLRELMERPDAPNLYWALAVVPRPLIDLRKQNEVEQKMLEMEFPILADLDRQRTPEQWEDDLQRLGSKLKIIGGLAGEPGGKGPKLEAPKLVPANDSPELPAAKKYLTEVAGLPAERVRAMPAAQVLFLYLLDSYNELRDEIFKAAYLPFPQSRAVSLEAEKRLKAAPAGTGTTLARLLLPAIPKVQLSQARIERKLAALRAIEALRMHAAAHGGELPDKLDDVKIVPVPNDPGTGQPFEYHRDGATATLTSRIPDQAPSVSGLRYRVTIRK
jgi:hypothetical protein